MEKGISPEQEAEIFDFILLNFTSEKKYTRSETQKESFYGKFGKDVVNNHLNALIEEEKKLKIDINGEIAANSAGNWILSNFEHKSYTAKLKTKKRNKVAACAIFFFTVIAATTGVIGNIQGCNQSNKKDSPMQSPQQVKSISSDTLKRIYQGIYLLQKEVDTLKKKVK